MRRNTLTLAIVLALCSGLITACDKPTPSAPKTDGSPISRAPSNLPSGAPPAQTKDGAPPVQGQVDTKQNEQTRDFQRPGEQTGPGTSKPGGG